jgi:hypothetical protein
MYTIIKINLNISVYAIVSINDFEWKKNWNSMIPTFRMFSI